MLTLTLQHRRSDLAEIKMFYGGRQKNSNEDRPILSAAKCRSMILVSRNMCEYSTGFLGDGLSKTVILIVSNGYLLE